MQLINRADIPAGGQQQIEFTDIPDTYQDLVIKVFARGTDSAVTTVNVYTRPNSSSTNFYARWARGSGTSDSYGSMTTNLFSGKMPTVAGTEGVFSNIEIYVTSYASSTNHKRFNVDATSEKDATTDNYTYVGTGIWENNTAISSILLEASSGDFAEGSVVLLYGIAAGSDGIVTVS